MPSVDMPLSQLRSYAPTPNPPADFDAYWASTLAESAKQPLDATFETHVLPHKDFVAHSVRFEGFGGGRVSGWMVHPAKMSGPLPGVMVYHGYSMWAAKPIDLISTAALGCVVMSMDTRGQNNNADNFADHSGGHVAGWMTKGIRDPRTYYYRYVYADAVRALEVLAHRPEVDASKIAVTGGSQGGGISLAAAALSNRVKLCLADIPFLCDFRRAIEITPLPPYTEIPTYLKIHPQHVERAMTSLAYIDNLNLAGRITARTVISNCLWDDICPPSTIFGVYHALKCDKHMHIYPYHKHEIPYEHVEIRMNELARMCK